MQYPQLQIYIFALYCLVFSAPMFFVGYTEKYVVALFFSTFFMGVGLLATRFSKVPKRMILKHRTLLECALIILVTLVVLRALGLAGALSDRATERGVVSNVNSEGSLSVTAASLLVYAEPAISAVLIQAGLWYRKRVFLFAGIIIASFLLASTGTRYLFLLAMAPLLYSVVLTPNIPMKLYTVAAAITFSSLIAVSRSAGTIRMVRLLVYDLPSTASVRAVETTNPQASEIVNFLIGNVLVLVPRAFLPNKPVDPTVMSFSADFFGYEAVHKGASYLPGFIGSAWLYGGLFSVTIFSLLYGFVFSRCVPRPSTRFRDACVLSLVFGGLLLQLRNISVFYLLPAGLVWGVVFSIDLIRRRAADSGIRLASRRPSLWQQWLEK